MPCFLRVLVVIFIRVSSGVLSDKRLWGGATDIAHRVWTSPFVQRACEGNLDALLFGQYMVQDIGCYMPGAIKVLRGLYERSLKEKGPANKITLYFNQMLNAYETYLAAEAKGWDLKNITCSRSCQAYIDFLREVAETKPYPQAIIAFAPCTVLWDWLGGRMKSCIRDGNAYNDWIKGLSGSGKAADFSSIDSLIHQSLLSDPIHSVATFREGMMREYEFFNSVIPGFTGNATKAVEAVANVALEQGDAVLPSLPSVLGLMYLALLTCSRVARGSQRKVMGAYEPLLK